MIYMEYTLFQAGKIYFNNVINYTDQFRYLKDTCQIYYNATRYMNHIKQIQDRDILDYNYPYPHSLYKYNRVYAHFNTLNIERRLWIATKNIHDVSRDNLSILQLLNETSKLPPTEHETLINRAIHLHEFTHSRELQNFSEHFRAYQAEDTDRNFYTNIYFKHYDVEARYTSFLVYYYLRSILAKYVNEQMNFATVFRNHIMNNTNRRNAVYYEMINTFNQSISSNSEYFCKNLTHSLSFIVYQLVRPSDTFNTALTNYIQNNEVIRLQNSIDDFVDTHKYSYLVVLFNLIHTLLYERIIHTATEELYVLKNQVMSFTKMREREIFGNYEFLKLKEYQKQITIDRFETYDLILNEYCKQPFKFVNNVPIICEQFIDEKIKSKDDFTIRSHDIKQLLNTNINLNYENIAREIEAYYNNQVFIDELMAYDGLVLDYAISLMYLEIIDDYIESEEFDEVLNSLLYNTYRFLRTNRYIGDDYYWIEGKRYIQSFLKSFLKNQILNESQYNNFKLQFIDSLDLLRQSSMDVPSREYIVNILKEIDTELIETNFLNIWQFYENMIKSTLTVNQINNVYSQYYV